MKPILTFCTAILFTAVAAAQSKADKIDELMLNYNKLNRFNGSILVAENNQVVLQKGYGYQDAATQKMNDEYTVYQVGSVTKQFTAAIILKLQEQKKLSVNDKLSKYFPGFPNGGKITLRHLLSHTAGIFNYTEDPQFMATEATKPATQQKMMALFKDKPLDFEPGTKWNYSNSGYLLLGYIIEKVTKKTYYQVFREVILQPLGMTQSGFNFTNLANGNKATGYQVLSEKNSQPAGIVDSAVSFAAGALYSSVPDLFLWAKQLNGQGRLLKPASWKQAFTPVKDKYGYGLAVDSLFEERVITHSGGIFGFNSNLLVIPAKGIAVIIISNVNTGELEAITQSLTAILLGRKYKIPEDTPPVIQVEAESLKAFEGEYELTPAFTIKIFVKEGTLFGQATGQPAFELAAERKNYFRVVGVAANLEFVSGAGGKVEKMILYQGGRQSDLKRKTQ